MEEINLCVNIIAFVICMLSHASIVLKNLVWNLKSVLFPLLMDLLTILDASSSLSW